MSATATVGAAIGIYNAAKGLYGEYSDKAKPYADRAKPYVDAYRDANESSLTQKAKKCFIESRAYVDKEIEHEKVTSGILKFSLSMQASLVIAALRLDGLVSGGVTVSNRLSSVATENNSNYVDIVELLKKDSLSLESLDPKLSKQEREEKLKFDAIVARVDKLKNEAEIKRHEARKAEMEADIKTAEKLKKDAELKRTEAQELERQLEKQRQNVERISSIKDDDVTPSTDVNLTVGKIINITMTADNGSQVTVPLFVRVNPYIVSQDMVSYMMETCGPTIFSGKRRAQLKAGEISFWKDYVFGIDLIKKQEKILAKDKDGEFAEYIRTQNKKDRKKITDAIRRGKDPSNYRTSSNLANAVLVFSQDAVDDGELRGGIKLHNYSDRQKFFEKSYASMIFVVDPNHERVTMYLNGFKDVGNYSYNDFVRKKDLEGEDFMSILRSVSQGQISRF